MIALILGVTGAVAFKPAQHKAKAGDSYYWFSPTGTPSYLGHENDVVTEQGNSNCNGANAVCERGYLGTQLNTTDDPSSGVQTGQIANSQNINEN